MAEAKAPGKAKAKAQATSGSDVATVPGGQPYRAARNEFMASLFDKPVTRAERNKGHQLWLHSEQRQQLLSTMSQGQLKRRRFA